MTLLEILFLSGMAIWIILWWMVACERDDYKRRLEYMLAKSFSASADSNYAATMLNIEKQLSACYKARAEKAEAQLEAVKKSLNPAT